MSKQKTRAETPQTLIQDEQLSDILLVMDQKELSVRAVSEIDKNGKAKTVPAEEERQNDFLKIDKHSGIVENFISNFRRQFKDPTRFRLFKLNFLEFGKVKEAIKDLTSGKNDTPAVKEFLKKYEIVPRDVAKEQSNNNNNENIMAEQKQTAENSTGRANRFNESMINWGDLKNFGLSREYLQEKGLLSDMLKGYKTNTLVPVSMNFGAAALRCDARLSFQQSKEGPVVLAMHGIRKTPELDKPFFGHIFSDEDKKNLRESGNMGRVADLKYRNGEPTPSLISIDKLTNDIVSLRVDSVYIPQEMSGVKLFDNEMEDLKAGKAIFVEGMISKNGKEFSANLQVNADKRGVEYIFDNDKLFNGQTLGGVKLTDKQAENLNEGKTIFVEDMKRKDGGLFSSFVKLDEASGKPAYTRYNPDSPEGAREIYVPKEMGGVPLTPEDRQELREGKPVFIENMINQKGEEYSSFVKLDLETGRPDFSRTPDGFNKRPEFKIPAEQFGVTFTATQRANLQDGKTIFVEGLQGYDGKEFSSFLKVNRNQGKLDYYTENPDLKKDASKRNVVADKLAEKQDSKNDDKPKKKKGHSVS